MKQLKPIDTRYKDQQQPHYTSTSNNGPGNSTYRGTVGVECVGAADRATAALRAPPGGLHESGRTFTSLTVGVSGTCMHACCTQAGHSSYTNVGVSAGISKDSWFYPSPNNEVPPGRERWWVAGTGGVVCGVRWLLIALCMGEI